MTVAEQIAHEEALGDDLKELAGQWVAVRDYQVIAAADSLGGLLEQIEGESQGEDEETTVFQVQDRDVVCFY